MSQRFEHCRMINHRIDYLGRTGLFEDKVDRTMTEGGAWDWLENEGWELVTVVVDSDGRLVHYFKRPYTGKR